MKLYPRWTTILRRMLLVVAAAATALALAYLEEDLRGQIAWKRFAAERAALGTPLDFEHYLPHRVTDGDNLFASKLVLELSRQDSAGSKKFEKGFYYLYDFWKSYGRWQDGVVTDFHAAYGNLTAKQPAAPYPGDRAAAGLVVAQFAAIAPQLDDYCEEARRLPLSQVGMRRDGMLDPNIFGFARNASYALAWRASSEIVEGRRDLAFRDTTACLRLVEGSLSAPVPLGLLVGNVIAVRSLQPLWEGCWSGIWSDEQLAAFQLMLSRMRPLHLLPRAVAAQTAISLPDPKLLPRWAPRGWAALTTIEYSRLGGEEYLKSFDPDTGRLNMDEINRFANDGPLLMHSLSPSTHFAMQRVWPGEVPVVAGEQCTLCLAYTACALERLRLRSGHYPASLAELVPAYLDSVPIDIVDGAPLRYRPTADGRYLLYSIGLNGVDDGGALPSSYKKRQDPWYNTRNGDWVWPRPYSGGTLPLLPRA
jgi:hypothetical protein